MREKLTQDEFIHLTDIDNLLTDLQKQSDWGKSETVKQVYDELLKLPRFTISVEREV